jgi:putative cardiolipin synthase
MTALRVVLLALCLLPCACATLRTDYPRPPSHAIPAAIDSPRAQAVAAELAAHPGASGFRMLALNTEALASRLELADAARHSIDLQYYIFANDVTGRVVAARLLAAADRGARIRILLDDLDVTDEDHLLDALDAHPRIEVRLFNPFRFRARSPLAKASQFLFEAPRLNRRMHNKSFIVDGLYAIIGGRNIGDAYFDAGDDTHFRDLDVLSIGPVVAATAHAFDAYWNSPAAYPVTAWSDPNAGAEDLARLRQRLAADARAFRESRFAAELREDRAREPATDGWLWGEARLVVDAPDKVDPDSGGSGVRIAHEVRAALAGARQEATIVSPYFIPGDAGEALLEDLAARGVTVSVLTNSLAANDEPAVHAGYLRYRPALVAAGVHLFEFRPVAGRNAGHARGRSSGLSLHAKAMVVDAREVYIGSMNFDPRSRWLNTEMGVIVDSPALAAAVTDFFDKASSPANAYRVEAGPCPERPDSRARLHWTAADDGHRVCHDGEPEVSAWKRIELQLWRVLPIEGLL